MRISRLAFIPVLASALSAAPAASVTVRNSLDIARTSETIVLDAAQLRTMLPVDDVRKVHVRPEGGDKDLIVQGVDTNDDGVLDQLIFQADFAAKQTRVFLLTVAERQIPGVADYKTYGRFVRERRDDFAWENDRIAHRMYGKELETWPQEPLTSSSVDVWSKRVRNLIINNWYMVDDYHKEHGEGADFYSAGKTRGDGGTGIWSDGKLYPSQNFVATRVYATGPIRVLFELTYDTWTAGGVKVSEKKRISLDAGQNLDRFESRYTIEGNAANVSHAIGLRKLKNMQMQPTKASGILRTWEPVKEGGEQGLGVIVDPANVKDWAEDELNYLVLTKIAPNTPIVHYAGFGWTLSGDFKTVADWDRYLADFAARLRSPLEVKLEKR